MKPKNWPKGFIYSRESFSRELHPMILKHLLATGKEEDLPIIHPLVEKKRVHPNLSIQKIVDKAHPLASSSFPEHGLFAKKKIPPGTDLGVYVGEIFLKDVRWTFPQDNYNYTLTMRLGQYCYLINSKQYANEIVFINDYRNIAPAPNTKMHLTVHRGHYYPMCSSIKTILVGEELLWDYGDNYWKN